MKTFGKGGIHPNPEKLTAGSGYVPLPDSGDECLLLLSQSIGKPAECVVRPGQYVAPGSLVGRASGFVSANVHSPVFAKVKKIDKVRDIKGFWKDAVILQPVPAEEAEGALAAESDKDLAGDSLLFERTMEEINALSPKEIVDIVREAGVVGLGGATFPTHVKISIPEGKNADYMLINGAECEPYLTCDDAIMNRVPEEIVGGAMLLAKAVGARELLIGIEANKPEAIRRMSEAVASAGVPASVVPLKTRYPQGGEKQLAYALTGRVIPAGGLPIDAGVVIDNVATALSVWMAVSLGTPLTGRVVTVTGPHLPNGGANFLVNIGTPVRKVIEAAGGIPEDTGKVISGGPMMGQAIVNLDAPVTKGCGGLTLFPESMSHRTKYQNCIRCAKCVEACPMGLQPFLLARYGQLSFAEESRAEGVMNCMECGCCSYTCPSGRPLVDWIRLAKTAVRNMK